MELIISLLSLFSASFSAWPLPVTAAVLVATFVLWVLFASVCTIAARLKVERRLLAYLALLVVGLPLLAVGIVVDVAYNATVGWLLFGTPPQEWTLTERLRKLISGPRGKDRTRAVWICQHLIEPWDPNHCGLIKLGVK